MVAMAGDGVNDVQALKQADLGIAMGSGSQASRSVARVVLLDGTFAAIPPMLAESRRVVANIERVARLFVTKTVYAAIIAIAVGLAGITYPFYPRHLTIISTLTIGVPGFFLALAPGAPRARPGFTRRVLEFTSWRCSCRRPGLWSRRRPWCWPPSPRSPCGAAPAQVIGTNGTQNSGLTALTAGGLTASKRQS